MNATNCEHRPIYTVAKTAIDQLGGACLADDAAAGARDPRPAKRVDDNPERGNQTMHSYLFSHDCTGPDFRFDAVSDVAALDYARELLADEGAEEGDGGGLYRIDEGGRGEEEYVGEVHVGDDE